MADTAWVQRWRDAFEMRSREAQAARAERLSQLAEAQRAGGSGSPPADESPPPTAGDVRSMLARAAAIGAEPRAMQAHDVEPSAADEQLASHFADVLDDFGSMPYYLQLATRVRTAALKPGQDRAALRRRLIVQAKYLAANRVPNGPIKKPGAAFAAWVRKSYGL